MEGLPEMYSASVHLEYCVSSDMPFSQLTIWFSRYSTCEIYAPCGLLGGLGFALFTKYYQDMTPEALLLGTWIGIAMRVIAYNHFVTLPIFKVEVGATSVRARMNA